MNYLDYVLTTIIGHTGIAAALGLLLCSTAIAQEVTDYRFSGPYSEDNLNVYLIHGKDEVEDPSKLLTLDEALNSKQALLHETGNVQELSIENVTKDKVIFVQAGDIVKGGRQDRVISQSFLLKPNSGKTPLSSFCVEQGRWSQRGSEASTAFSSAKKRISSKGLKLAAMSQKEQTQVWGQVAEMQDKLAKNVGAPVAAPASPSSLQLSLESKGVEQSTRAYKNKLGRLVEENPDAIGYVFAVNGQLNSAEIYGAHEIFKRSWTKLLDAAASEALAEQGQKYEKTEYKEAQLKTFLADADNAPEQERTRAQMGETLRREDGKAMFIGTRMATGAGWVHKQYLKK